jgi:LCP family protein required for cell wall assembly
MLLRRHVRTPAAGDQTVRRPNRARRRIALGIAALTVWVAGSALGTASTPSAQALPRFAIGVAHPAEAFPVLNGKKPIFVLALGSDARPGEPIDKERSDSIHIIGLNPAKHTASILGFPRDSYVDIPGHGKDKITAAMSFGGPKLTVQTIENLTGIHIDFYVLTSFVGLKEMINAIGGVTVTVLQPMHDHFSGADFEPGKTHMDGAQALSFARDRHDFSRGDLDRSLNQGRLFLATLGEFEKDFQKDPGVMLTYIGAGMRNVETDLPLSKVVQLGFTAAKIPPKSVINCIVPAVGGVVGSADVVFIQAGASALYADMKPDGLLKHC